MSTKTRRNAKTVTAVSEIVSSEPVMASISKRTRSNAKETASAAIAPTKTTRSKRNLTKISNGGDVLPDPSSSDANNVVEQSKPKAKRNATKTTKKAPSVDSETVDVPQTTNRRKRNVVEKVTTSAVVQDSSTNVTAPRSTRSTRSKNVEVVETKPSSVKKVTKKKLVSPKKKASPKKKSQTKKENQAKVTKKVISKNDQTKPVGDAQLEATVPPLRSKRSLRSLRNDTKQTECSSVEVTTNSQDVQVSEATSSSQPEAVEPKKTTRAVRAAKKEAKPITVSDRKTRPRKRDINIEENIEKVSVPKKPRQAKVAKETKTVKGKMKKGSEPKIEDLNLLISDVACSEESAGTSQLPVISDSNKTTKSNTDKKIDHKVDDKSVEDKPIKIKSVGSKRQKATRANTAKNDNVDSNEPTVDVLKKSIKTKGEQTVVKSVRFDDELIKEEIKSSPDNVDSCSKVRTDDDNKPDVKTIPTILESNDEQNEKLPDDENFEVIDMEEVYRIKASDVIDSVVSEVERTFESISDPDQTELVSFDEQLFETFDVTKTSSSQNGNSADTRLGVQLIESNSSMKRKLDDLIDDSTEYISEIKRIRSDDFVGDLFTLGEQLVGETGPRDVFYKGQKVKINQPARVKLNCKVRQVACGAYHTIVLTDDYNVISFGCNDDSSLGRNTTKPTETGNGNNTTDFSDDDGEEIDPGEYDEKMSAKPLPVIGISSNVIKLCAGDMLSSALTVDGKVFIWGNIKDESNKLGLFVDDLDLSSNDAKPTRVPRQVNLEKKAVDIASGCHHLLILTDDGQVYSLGEGSKGQLGRITTNELTTIKSNRDLFLTAQLVKFPTPVSIKRVFASQWCSFALTDDGVLYGWGLNNYFQLGFRTETPVEIVFSDNNNVTSLLIELTPVRVPIDNKVSKVSNGQQHVVVLDTDGQVYTCGSALYGKLGLGKEFVNNFGSEQSSLKKLDQKLFGNEPVINVECGDFCSMAITKSGKLYTWGQGSPHIGTNSERDLFEPTPIGGAYAADAKFSSVSCGAQYASLVGVLKN